MFCVSNNIGFPEEVYMAYRDENLSIILSYRVILTPNMLCSQEIHDDEDIDNFLSHVIDLRPFLFQKLEISSIDYARVHEAVELFLPGRAICISEVNGINIYEFSSYEEFLNPCDFLELMKKHYL